MSPGRGSSSAPSLDQDVARLAVHAHDPAGGGVAEAVDHVGLVHRAVEHRPDVVGHPPVHGHVRAHARDLLDRAHRVERHARVAHQRAAGLAQHGHALGRVRQHGLGVLLGRRRAVLARVGDGEAAAQVQQREVADLAQHVGQRLVHVQVEDLRADVRVQPAQLQARAADALQRPLHVAHGDAELGVLLAGADGLVGLGLDAGRHAHAGSADRTRPPRAPAARSRRSCPRSRGRRPTRPPAPARPRTCCCRAGRSARGRSPRSAPGAARRRTRSPPTAPPRRRSAARRWRGTPWTRRAPRTGRCGRRTRRAWRGRGRADRPRRTRRRGCRTRAPARARHSRRCAGRRPAPGRSPSGTRAPARRAARSRGRPRCGRCS